MSPKLSILRRICRVAAGDDGAAAVSFILTFPIFMLIVAIIVQLALMVTAKLMVSHAADVAARAAMTALPAGEPEKVSQAAWLALAPVSPEAQTPDTAGRGAVVAAALNEIGAEVPESFAARYDYAAVATDVSWAPDDDFVGRAGRPVEVNLTYQFRLTVPFAMRIVPADDGSIGGVAGRFWSVSAQRRVQAAHGREAQIDRSFWSR